MPNRIFRRGKPISRSVRAGLVFPVGRIARYLKKGKYADRIASGAPVYLTAVLEYLTAEVLELAGNAARDLNKKRIIPHHLQLAVRNDGELSKLLANVTISSAGVVPPFIHPVLLPGVLQKVKNLKQTKQPKKPNKKPNKKPKKQPMKQPKQTKQPKQQYVLSPSATQPQLVDSPLPALVQLHPAPME